MSKKKITATSLPLSKTHKIMTSAVGVEKVDQDIVALVTKATELFLVDFARRAYELSDSNSIEYDDIQKLVHSDPRYDFLVDTTPKRIKFEQALKLIEEAKQLEAEALAHVKTPTRPASSKPEHQPSPPRSDDHDSSSQQKQTSPSPQPPSPPQPRDSSQSPEEPSESECHSDNQVMDEEEN